MQVPVYYSSRTASCLHMRGRIAFAPPEARAAARRGEEVLLECLCGGRTVLKRLLYVGGRYVGRKP